MSAAENTTPLFLRWEHLWEMVGFIYFVEEMRYENQSLFNNIIT
jgi:hypothetical protein